MENLYEPVIDCMIKHSLKILSGNYDHSGELFDYAKPGIYSEKISSLAEHFGMMMVKLEAREFALNETISKLQAKEQEIRYLYQAFVETIVAAIDARDPATAGHSKRMARYAVELCKAINNTDCGQYQSVQFSDSEIQEMYYAALLHDVGKIGVSESILLKKNRLSDERMLTIEYRFKYYKQCLRVKEMSGVITKQEMEMLANMDNYYQFITEMNRRDAISLEEQEQLIRISQLGFLNEDGTISAMLDNFEKKHLIVKYGNLTDDERMAMNMHATYTAEILKAIPWEHTMQQLTRIAAGHHEKLDGSGYPKGLTAKDIPIQARILTIIDIFDALTAFDRPYKPAISIETAIGILNHDVDLGRIDKEILEIFYQKVVLYKEGK